MKKNRLALTANMVLLVVSSTAIAEVYRCTDPVTKKITYSGTPCAKGDEHKVSITDNAIMNGSAAKRTNAPVDAGGTVGGAHQQAAVEEPAESSAEDQATRARLADECSRGFKQSCSTLRLMNAAQPASSAQSAATSAKAKQLAEECSRGFKKSCNAYRALNGEQERTKTVCNTVGVTNAYAQKIGDSAATVDGTYRGKTVCRERPEN